MAGELAGPSNPDLVHDLLSCVCTTMMGGLSNMHKPLYATSGTCRSRSSNVQIDCTQYHAMSQCTAMAQCHLQIRVHSSAMCASKHAQTSAHTLAEESLSSGSQMPISENSPG